MWSFHLKWCLVFGVSSSCMASGTALGYDFNSGASGLAMCPSEAIRLAAGPATGVDSRVSVCGVTPFNGYRAAYCPPAKSTATTGRNRLAPVPYIPNASAS